MSIDFLMGVFITLNNRSTLLDEQLAILRELDTVELYHAEVLETDLKSVLARLLDSASPSYWQRSSPELYRRVSDMICRVEHILAEGEIRHCTL